MRKKSTAENAEFFLWKDQKHKSFYGYGLLSAFRSSGDEDLRMNEEEAESAEIISWKSLCSLGLQGSDGNGALFPMHPGP
jgi:hypothetical protein